jgi:hypothetical protein
MNDIFVVTYKLVSVMLKIIIIQAKDGVTGLYVVIKPQDKNIGRSVFTFIYIYIYIYI